MANEYNKGVSDWSPKPPSGEESREKLFSVNAVENPDMLNGTNKLEQIKTSVSAKSYGELGQKGHAF